MNQEFTVSELAAFVGGTTAGDGAAKIFGVAAFETARPGEIAFVEDAKFFSPAAESKAACLIVPPDAELNFKNSLIRHEKPKLAFARIAQLIYAGKQRPAEIHRSAVIAQTADVRADFIGAFVNVGENSVIGEGTQILEGTRVGDNVKVGKNCTIHPNVVLYDNVILGESVVLHAGVVVGAPGFGYVRGAEGYVKFPQIGTVVIEDDVEIGANSCIDRGALGETRIGRGSKIDNLVQIAHNVVIGERVIVAAQTGISGSTVIENDCVIGGQVGMGDHARVLSGAIIGSKAGVLPGKIVRAGVWWGVPVQPLDDYKRQNAHLKALPRLREEVKELQAQLLILKSKISSSDLTGEN